MKHYWGGWKAGFGADWIKTGFHDNRKRPLNIWENDVSTFSLLFLIRSFSNLQVTRTGIKSRTSSNFGRIGSDTLEFCANERKTKKKKQKKKKSMCSISGVGRKAALGFGADWIKTVVVMAIKSSHWLIMGKMESSSFLSFLIEFSPNLQVSRQALILRWVQIPAGLDHSLQCYAPYMQYHTVR